MPKTRWRFAAALSLVGGPHSFSWLTFLFFALPIGLANVLVDPRGNSETTMGWFITALFATVVAAVLFLVYGTWIYPLAKTPRSQLFSALIGFAIIGIARGLSVATLSTATGIADDPLLLYRTFMAAVYSVVIMSLTAMLVNDARAYERQRAELDASVAELESLQGDLVGRVNKLQQELISDTAAEVKLSVTSITQALKKNNQNAAPADFVDRIIDVIDGQIRPLSSRLLSVPSVPDSHKRQFPKTLTPRQILTAATSRDVFAPGPVIVVWILISLALGMSLRLGFAGALTFFLFSAILVAGLVLARALVGKRLGKFRLWVRVVTITSIYLASALVASSLSAPLLPETQVASASQAQLVLRVYTPVFAVLFCWIFAIINGLNFERSKTLAALEKTQSAIKRNIAIAQSMLHITSKRLSRRVHGEVQGTLLANAFRIQQAIDKGDDLAPALADMEKDIEAINVTELVLAPVPSIDEAIAEDRLRWDKAMAITLDISEDAQRALSADEPARSAIIDTIREALGNAFKHGHATEVSISIELDDHETVRVTARDNGQGVVGEIVPGNGTVIVSDLSLDFGFESSPQGFEIWATFPLSVPA